MGQRFSKISYFRKECLSYGECVCAVFVDAVFVSVCECKEYLDGPYGLLQWVEQFKAESVFLRRPLDEFACTQ